MYPDRSSSFMFRSANIIFFFFFFFILFLVNDVRICLGEQQQDEDLKKYANCSRNFTCGDGVTIGYPFSGNTRPDYCGFPGYHLECKDGLFTEIQIISQKYRVLDINPANRIMTITRTDFMEDYDACPDEFSDTTLNFTIFNYYPTGIMNLTLSYGCRASTLTDEEFRNKFNCQTNVTTNSDAYFWSQSFEGVPPGTPLGCNKTIIVPVMERFTQKLASDPKSLSSVLREGFGVTYEVGAASSIAACIGCVESGGACGYGNSITIPSLVCYCANEPNQIRTICSSTDAPAVPPPGPLKTNIKRRVRIGVGAGVGGSLLTAILVVLVLYCRRRRKSYLDNSSALISSQNISPDLSMKPDPEKGFITPIFSYKELEEATNNFDDSKELGDGGFGTVYYGELKDGRAVAVKRLYENNCKRVEQFMNEVNILSCLRHKNLVILYGCTSRHSRELLLVYEFVPNGTVADHLHGERAGSGLVSWPIRMNIAIETAGALTYLHASDIVHRDVKTNNILLDDNFHVKVADFGLSRLFPTDVTHVSTAPQGTPGYVDPEYYQCYQLTDKSDVYSFGVVLIELISSKPAVDISRHRHEINLANLAITKIHNHALHELVDPSLGFETDLSVKRMITLVAELAFRCLQQDTDMRPSMVEVLEVLKGIENEGSKMVEMDIPADDVGLLKNTIPPPSPDSVTQNWDSNNTTPNSSS